MGLILLEASNDAFILWLSMILCGIGLIVVYKNWKKKK